MTEITNKDILQPVRIYKDRVFRMIFKEKDKLLELYNAMNGTDYKNPEDLIITTLENAIYLGMKNDISFLLYDQLSLYEHQSTKNPNIPLRDLLYVANVYSNLTKNRNLYGTKQVMIPEPKFVMFYNGMEKIPERFVMKLSDAYEHLSEEPALELKVLVLNINPGYNRELMKKCRTLEEYMVFVGLVREYSQTMDLAEAVEQAINECIAANVLAEFLRKNRAEVKSVSIFEYDEEKHIQQERDEAMKKGEERLAKLIQILIDSGRNEDLSKAVADLEYREQLYRENKL